MSSQRGHWTVEVNVSFAVGQMWKSGTCQMPRNATSQMLSSK